MQQSKIVKKTEIHLRNMSRQLIKIDSEEEALQYISNSFKRKLHCDFVGVVFMNEETYNLRITSGNVSNKFTAIFPVNVQKCSKKLIQQSMTDEQNDGAEGSCKLIDALNDASVKTWFTVPILDDAAVHGFCIIGFYKRIPLLEMKSQFEELGKDIALAIHLTRKRKKQLKKMEGIEWVTNHFSLDRPFKEKIAEITRRAGKGTGARYACVYLFNDIDNEFVFQTPSYGEKEMPQKIKVISNYTLKNYFPYLDSVGTDKLTALIAMDFKTIGVIHLEDKETGVFTEEDLDTVQLLSTHIATTLENARLYHNERQNHNRLRNLLKYQEALVRETVVEDGFTGITNVVHHIFQRPIILFDRFKSCLYYQSVNDNELNIYNITEKIKDVITDDMDYFLIAADGQRHTVWPIKRGDELLGYLSVAGTKDDLDEYEQLLIEMAKNIYAIQFSKQKLVHGTTEQAKENLAVNLLVKKIKNKGTILQYANLFHWNIFKPHRVAILSLEARNKEGETDLLAVQMKETAIWDYLKQYIFEEEGTIVAAPYKEQYALFIPEKEAEEIYYRNLMEEINEIIKSSSIACAAYLGVGSVTAGLEDYYRSSEQAWQALKIVKRNFYEENFAFFEKLGAYTILQHLQQVRAANLFMENQLEPLISYSEKSNMDLLHTLRTYLSRNGNAKQTAEILFLHRSSLRYRLEKIEELLDVRLNNPEHIFQLTMALKLYDMRI